MNIENHTPLFFTDNAAVKVKQLIAEEGNLNLKLRVLSTAEAVQVFSMALLLMN